MAAGFVSYPRVGLAAAYSANNCRYTADYPAAAKSFSSLLDSLESLNNMSAN
jgi:hypothetical protein